MGHSVRTTEPLSTRTSRRNAARRMGQRRNAREVQKDWFAEFWLAANELSIMAMYGQGADASVDDPAWLEVLADRDCAESRTGPLLMLGRVRRPLVRFDRGRH
jgi:hypothetical protein